MNAEQLAKKFHEAYERLAPSFGYKTREASAKPWEEVPEQNRQLMIAVCNEIAGDEATETYQEKAKRLVFDYIKPRLEKTDKHVTFAPDEVYVVWWSKVLQNWKCLISTTLPDGMYYEVTYNGDKGETYIDAYKKFDNVCVPDGWKPEPPA